jgi:hypothetical protein
MANKKKKVKDKQREKNKIKKAKAVVKAFFEEKKNDTITYECLSCGAETEVPRLSIEMHTIIDEFGDVDIPGYACEACDATMVVRNPEKLNLKEAEFEEVFEEFKNKNF